MGSKTRIWLGVHGKGEHGAHTERGQEESASPHSWRVESTPLGKTAAGARGSGAHRTLLGSQFSKGILGGQSWVCFHLNTRAHTQSRRTRPCTPAPMCANEPRTQGQTPSQEAHLDRSACRQHLFPLCSLARHPGGQEGDPFSSSESIPLQLSPIPPPGSSAYLTEAWPPRTPPGDGQPFHPRLAPLPALRPLFESRGARIPEARGLEPRRPASQGGVFPPS